VVLSRHSFYEYKEGSLPSGPPTHIGYCAKDLQSAQKLFFWFALAKTFVQASYPLCFDADNMWEPIIPETLKKSAFQMSIAIGYAENECVETTFPANNPIKGVPEVLINNPLTPLSKESFWAKTLKVYCSDAPVAVKNLIRSVDDVFREWASLIHQNGEMFVSDKQYLLGNDPLPLGSGLLQIRDYAREAGDDNLLAGYGTIQANLKLLKAEFSEMLLAENAVNYFGVEKKKQPASVGIDVSVTVPVLA